MEKVIAKRTLRGSYYENRSFDREKNIILKRRKIKEPANTFMSKFKERIIYRFYIKAIIALAVFCLIFLINIFKLEYVTNSNLSKKIITEFNINKSYKEIISKVESITLIAYNQIKDFIPNKVKQETEKLVETIKIKFNKNYILLNKEVKIYESLKLKSVGASVDTTYGLLRNTTQVQSQELFYIKENNILFAKPTTGIITSPFGEREVIFKDIDSYHYGIDIANKEGTSVYSSIDGEVTYVGNNKYNGNYVEVTNKKVVTKYCHLKKHTVNKNDKIKQGDLIGYMGNTGYSTGPHLHFEVVINGVKTDPAKIIKF